MTRHPILPLGLLSLALGLVLAVRPALPQEPSKATPRPNEDVLIDQVVPHQAAAPGAAPAETHGEEKPNILKANYILGISTLVVFLVLLWVLGKFAWGPLQKALHDREESLEHTLQATERARQEGERLLAEHRKQMEQAAEQVRAIMDQAHRDAEATAADILRKAQAEAEAARHRAERDIATARDQALVELWTKASDLAVSVAGRVLSKELGADDHRRLVAAAIQELPDRPPGANGHGGHRA
jgi:F-type H+-transporting ATPase subunit b